MSGKHQWRFFFSLSSHSHTALRTLFTVQFFCLLIFVCICLSETVFFDQLIYQKSRSHGYWLWKRNEHPSEGNYGKRARDISYLALFMPNSTYNRMYYPDPSEKILTQFVPHPGILSQSEKSRPFRVALIGDSFLWGQGVTEKHRTSFFLEKLLASEGNFEVKSYSIPGDSIVDHYIKYLYLEKSPEKADFYIFGLVNNDLIFNESTRYDKNVVDTLAAHCGGRPLFLYQMEMEYNQQLETTLKPEYANTCMLEILAANLPKKNAVYIDLQALEDKEHMRLYLDTLRKNALKVIISSPRIKQKLSPSQLVVSQQDLHPSKYVHPIYAEIMKEEVLQYIHTKQEKSME